MRSLWLHRKGNSVHAAVQDTIDAIWKQDLKPLIIKKHKSKTKSEHTFIIHLPSGICYADFKVREPYFRDATGGAVQIEKRGKAVFLMVMTDELQTSYPFSWDRSEHKNMYLPVPFGYSALGPIVRDLADAPNLIIAGHPGAGKSNFLHVLAVSLLLSRDIQLVIIDMKKLEFSYLKNHALVVTSIPEAQNVLHGINRELDRRLHQLEAAGVVKVQNYLGYMPFVVLVIDEMAEMQDEECQVSLNRILRLGRAPGICCVTATQRPSSTMFQKFGDSKAMFAATMCFHVRDAVNSRMLLDNDRAALIPNIPGRAIYQWERELEIQAMFLPDGQAKKLVGQVKKSNDKCNDFGRCVNIEPPKRLPPRQLYLGSSGKAGRT